MSRIWRIAVWAVAALLTAFGVGTTAWRLLSPEVSAGFVQTTDSTVFSSYVLVGALLATRQPRNPVGWLLVVAGTGLVLAHFGDAYAEAAYTGQVAALPLGSVADWLASWTWILTVAAVPFLLLLFPDGRLPSRRWRPLVWVLGIAATVGVTLNPTYLWTLRDTSERMGDLPGTPVAGILIGSALVLIGGIVVAGASLVLRHRRAREVQRQQLRWLAAAVVLVVVAVLGGVAGEAFRLDLVYMVAVDVIGTAGFVGVPIAIAVAVLRYRLYEIDRIISRTVLYGTVVAVLTGVYALGVVVLGRVLSPFGAGNDLTVAASTLAVAALFRPLVTRLRTAVDRRFDRRRYDARSTVERFVQRLRDEVDGDRIRSELRVLVRTTLSPTHVDVWIPHREGGTS